MGKGKYTRTPEQKAKLRINMRKAIEARKKKKAEEIKEKETPSEPPKEEPKETEGESWFGHHSLDKEPVG